ncbi:hypothetical protein MRX96_011803 [Rhipicephalus microplus]
MQRRPMPVRQRSLQKKPIVDCTTWTEDLSGGLSAEKNSESSTVVESLSGAGQVASTASDNMRPMRSSSKNAPPSPPLAGAGTTHGESSGVKYVGGQVAVSRGHHTRAGVLPNRLATAEASCTPQGQLPLSPITRLVGHGLDPNL